MTTPSRLLYKPKKPQPMPYLQLLPLELLFTIFSYLSYSSDTLKAMALLNSFFRPIAIQYLFKTVIFRINTTDPFAVTRCSLFKAHPHFAQAAITVVIRRSRSLSSSDHAFVNRNTLQYITSHFPNMLNLALHGLTWMDRINTPRSLRVAFRQSTLYHIRHLIITGLNTTSYEGSFNSFLQLFHQLHGLRIGMHGAHTYHLPLHARTRARHSITHISFPAFNEWRQFEIGLQWLSIGQGVKQLIFDGLTPRLVPIAGAWISANRETLEELGLGVLYPQSKSL